MALFFYVPSHLFICFFYVALRFKTSLRFASRFSLSLGLYYRVHWIL